jgi:cell division protein FtsB
MDIARHLRRQLKSIVGPAIGLTLSAYFGYHLVEGDRGLIAWVRLSQQIRETQAEAAQIHAEREAQDQRVSLLRQEHLDPDMLDEQARAALNLVGPNEIVILNNEQGKPAEPPK